MMARMEERFKAYIDLGPKPPQQQQPQAPPRPDQDIFGAVDHVMKTVNGIQTEIGGYKEKIAAEERAKQLKDWGGRHEAEFIKEAPDYYQALNHLREARHRELAAMGLSPEAGHAQVLNEENQLLTHAARMQKNPAQLAYEIAKTRGYVKKDAPPPAEDLAKKLERVEAGQRQSGSLSDLGGGVGTPGEITLEMLTKMPDHEFLAFKAKNPAKFRRLKGAEH